MTRRDGATAPRRFTAKCCRRFPDHPDALHLLGVIAHQRGRQERAIQLIERALAIMPEFAPAHLNLGNALKAAGRRSEALNSYRRAIELKPDYAGAWCNLAALHRTRPIGSGPGERRSRDRADADFAEAYVNRAHALLGQRRFAEVGDGASARWFWPPSGSRPMARSAWRSPNSAGSTRR